jgi:hypothetical protein
MPEDRILAGNWLPPIISASPVLRVVIQVVLLGACFVAGYLVAGWWSRTRDTPPLAQICARVD